MYCLKWNKPENKPEIFNILYQIGKKGAELMFLYSDGLSLIISPISTSGMRKEDKITPPTQTFWKIQKRISWCELRSCDFHFISIWHILRNFQGSAALGSPVGSTWNFRKFIILYKFHIFCILYICW